VKCKCKLNIFPNSLSLLILFEGEKGSAGEKGTLGEKGQKGMPGTCDMQVRRQKPS